jgi:hypothetical protein
VAGAVVVALVPASYVTAHRVFHDTAATPVERPVDLPIPPVSPSAIPSSSPPAAPEASATPAKSLPSVSAEAPRRIVSDALLDTGFDSAVTSLDASSDAEVARWELRGSPGSPGDDTVYVVGRVRTDRDSAFAALPRLVAGGKVSIRTDAGTMTYTVTQSGLAREDGLRNDPLFTTHRPGRLVLVGIRYDAAGNRLPHALVVTAELSDAQSS